MPKVKVFVSGTYNDMKPHRRAINDLLRRMQTETIDMEYFPMAEEEPTVISLDKLDESDIYLAIIGHRYGTVPPTRPHSITRCEYERAYTLWKTNPARMRLLILLATNETAHVPPDLHEGEEFHRAQLEFRNLVTARHTIHMFSNEEDLVSKAAGELHNLILKKDFSVQEVRFFESHELDLIKEQFDSAIERQVKSVGECLSLIADSFSEIFSLTQTDLLAHPLLKRLDRGLRRAIPEVCLELHQGKITRTGVRHVVLRAETFRYLVNGIPPSERKKLGFQIGKGAATDLTENTIKKKRLIPKSPEALVALWNYWDRTGGWGSIRHERPASTEPTARAGGAHPEWCICVDHNSLSETGSTSDSGSLTLTSDLTDFWCGYIGGFLDTALDQLSDIISSLKNSDSELVTIPAYIRVVSVQHQACPEESTDRFTVRFKDEPFSLAREHLLRSQQSFTRLDYFGTMGSAQNALAKAAQIADNHFDSVVESMSLDIDEKTTLKAILAQETPRRPQREQAEKWFRLANRIVHNLTTDRGSGSL